MSNINEVDPYQVPAGQEQIEDVVARVSRLLTGQEAHFILGLSGQAGNHALSASVILPAYRFNGSGFESTNAALVADRNEDIDEPFSVFLSNAKGALSVTLDEQGRLVYKAEAFYDESDFPEQEPAAVSRRQFGVLGQAISEAAEPDDHNNHDYVQAFLAAEEGKACDEIEATALIDWLWLHAQPDGQAINEIKSTYFFDTALRLGNALLAKTVTLRRVSWLDCIGDVKQQYTSVTGVAYTDKDDASYVGYNFRVGDGLPAHYVIEPDEFAKQRLTEAQLNAQLANGEINQIEYEQDFFENIGEYSAEDLKHLKSRSDQRFREIEDGYHDVSLGDYADLRKILAAAAYQADA